MQLPSIQRHVKKWQIVSHMLQMLSSLMKHLDAKEAEMVARKAPDAIGMQNAAVYSAVTLHHCGVRYGYLPGDSCSARLVGMHDCRFLPGDLPADGA
jgi:hypothetical protein